MEIGGIYSPLILGILSIVIGFGILVLNQNLREGLIFFGFGILSIVFHFGVGILEDLAQ